MIGVGPLISTRVSKVREFKARHMYSLEDVIVGAGHFTAAIRSPPLLGYRTLSASYGTPLDLYSDGLGSVGVGAASRKLQERPIP